MGTSTSSAAARAFTVMRPSDGGQSMSTKSKSSITDSMARFSLSSRLKAGTSSISAPARAMVAGATKRFFMLVGSTQSSSEESRIRTSYIESSKLRASIPRPVVALPWGSRSMTRTRNPSSASAAPRLTDVVVLPTPPFWLATARTRGSGLPEAAWGWRPVGVAVTTSTLTGGDGALFDCSGMASSICSGDPLMDGADVALATGSDTTDPSGSGGSESTGVSDSPGSAGESDDSASISPDGDSKASGAEESGTVPSAKSTVSSEVGGSSGSSSPESEESSNMTAPSPPDAAASAAPVEGEPGGDGLFRPRRRPRIIVSSSRQGARASYSPALTLTSSISANCFT